MKPGGDRAVAHGMNLRDSHFHSERHDFASLARLLRRCAWAVLALALFGVLYGLFEKRDEPFSSVVADLLHIPAGAAVLIAACLIAARYLEKRMRRRS
jgi:hypothetical protein